MAALPARVKDESRPDFVEDTLRPPKRPMLLAASAVAALVGLLVVLWVRARPWNTRFVNTPAKLGALSSLAALIGLLLFCVTIVLSARIRYVEGALGGLDRMYRVHHRLGAIAFSCLALHPVFLAWRYAQVSWERAARLWWPTTSDWPLVAGQVALYGMAAGMVVTFYVAVRHQSFVWTQRLLGVLLFPVAYHALRIGGDTASYRPLRWYVWCIIAVAVAALIAHTLLGRLTTRHWSYQVASVVRLPGAVTELWLRPVGRALSFLPGQFVFVHFHSGAVSSEPHPFSIASPPAAGDIRLAIKDLGDYTRHVGEIEVGAEATVEGPYGRFSHRLVAGRRQVWVAGGIGIAPFLSMAAALPTSPYHVDLFYGFVDERDAPFLDELRALAAANARLRVHFVDERVDGLISASSIVASAGSLEGREFLLCGPSAMMHVLHDQLVDAGVSRDHVHFEEFGFS
jgi:predicted ferric reductase